MTYSPLINNTGSDADQFNGNYLHVGRCGFSNFYGMDVNGAYVAQPLGASATPWLSAHIGLLAMATNEITTITVDGDIKITPNGTGRTITGRQLGTQIIDTTNSIYTTGTEYTATDSDLYVSFWGVNTGGNPELSIKTGATIGASATLTVGQTIVVSNTTGFVSAMIKKGHKWIAYTTGVTSYCITTTETS